MLRLPRSGLLPGEPGPAGGRGREDLHAGLGDADGVLVVPQPIVGQTLRLALAKVEGENRTRDELKQGALLADVYAKYGVL